MNVAVILGTRPEIIKLSPIIRELQNTRTPFFIIHTGQHYSYDMDRIFFKELNLPAPNYNLDVGSGPHALQTAQMLTAIGPILERELPDVVVVQGDTNSVLAGALAAVKLGIPIAHVEAGLRSHDRRMPEEINRILTDHMSQVLFAPTEVALQNLRHEGVGFKPFITEKGERMASLYNVGNSVVDATQQHIQMARTREADLLGGLALTSKGYVLLTAHRAENVDNSEFLHHLCQLLADVRERYTLDVVWPIHPRTVKRLKEFGIVPPATLIEPRGYLEFLVLEFHARLIVSDSGGVQEEACVLGVPCVTIRKTTDRPETVFVGASELGGITLATMKEAFEKMMTRDRTWRSPYVPDTSRTIVQVLNNMFNKDSALLSSRASATEH